jgi:hypothetical protein
MRLSYILFITILGTTVLGCGKPTPEKSCAKAAELSKNVVETDCVKTLKSAQREKMLDEVAACIDAAKNEASVEACLRDYKNKPNPHLANP